MTGVRRQPFIDILHIATVTLILFAPRPHQLRVHQRLVRRFTLYGLHRPPRALRFSSDSDLPHDIGRFCGTNSGKRSAWIWNRAPSNVIHVIRVSVAVLGRRISTTVTEGNHASIDRGQATLASFRELGPACTRILNSHAARITTPRIAEA